MALLLSLIIIPAYLGGLASGKPPCPAQTPCQCTDLRIKCVQQESEQLNYLEKVPYFAPNNFETRWSYNFHELRIRDQAMTNLTLRFAWGVLNLRRVEVSSSLVRQIRHDAFQGLEGVDFLNLSHNLLSSLSSDDLRQLPLLRELVLHNNLIKMLHPGAFRHTAGISKLYLSHNLLSEVPRDIRQLSGLTHLYLQFNNISVVRDNAFYGLRKLIILDLGALRSNLVIEQRAFCGLTTSAAEETPAAHTPTLEDGGLVALYLRQNIFLHLDLCAIGNARSLRGLNLTGSFFPCSCQAMTFASQSDWPRRYGFAPRFVTYETSLLHNCNLDCSQESTAPCPDVCSAGDSGFNDAAPPPPSTSLNGPSLNGGSWFESRPSAREDGGPRSVADSGQRTVAGPSGSLLILSAVLLRLSSSCRFLPH